VVEGEKEEKGKKERRKAYFGICFSFAFDKMLFWIL